MRVAQRRGSNTLMLQGRRHSEFQASGAEKSSTGTDI